MVVCIIIHINIINLTSISIYISVSTKNSTKNKISSYCKLIGSITTITRKLLNSLKKKLDEQLSLFKNSLVLSNESNNA